MKKLPTLPTNVLKEHPSLAYWYAHRKKEELTKLLQIHQDRKHIHTLNKLHFV